MKHILTIGALALSVPAIAMAQAPDVLRDDHDQLRTQQPQAQQPEQHRQDQHRQDQQRPDAQRAQQQAGQKAGQKQAGHHAAQKRITHLEQNHIKLNDLEGTSIVNRQDEEIGSVADVVLDREGRVAAVLVNSGGVMGIGGTTKALSWNDVDVRAKSDEDDEYKIVVNMNEAEFDNLPEFEAERRTTKASQ